MAKVFNCSCGTKTTEPFYIMGRLLCTLCAETENPRIVNHRAKESWRAFTATNHKVPTRPYPKNWDPDGE